MKKLFIILLSVLSVMLVCAGCGAMDGYTASTLEISGGVVQPSDDGIELDGSPTEQKWQGVKHHTHTEGGAVIDTATVFGEDGLYIGVSVSVNGVYFVEPFNFGLNSCIAVFIAPSNLPNDQYGTGYFVITNDPYYSNNTVPMPYLSKTVVSGEMDSASATGISTEIYLPYTSLKGKVRPDSIDIYVNYNRTRGNSSAKANGTWIKAARNDSVAFYYTFDESGYVNADGEGDALGDAADGTAKTGGWDLSGRKDGVYHSVKKENQFIFVREKAATDYSIEATVRAVGGINDGSPHWGIMAAASGDKKIAMLMDGSAAIKSRTFRLRTLDYTTDWRLSAPDVQRSGVDMFGTGAKMKVIKDGKTLYYILNGELIHAEEISLDGPTSCGLYTVGGEAYFSDVKFVSYDGNKSGLYAALAQCSGNAIILPEAITGGKITAEKMIVADGEAVSVTFAADSGYRLKTVVRNGRNVTADVKANAVNGKWSFVPSEDARFSAMFERIPDGESATVSGTLKSNKDDKIGDVFLSLKGGSNGYYEVQSAGSSFSVTVEKGDYELYIKPQVHYGVTKSLSADGDIELGEIAVSSSKGLPVNASIKTDDGKTLTGDVEYEYGDDCVYAREVGLYYNLLEGSYGSVGMVTATVSFVRSAGDADPSAGFVFLPSADRNRDNITDNARQAGFTLLWWQDGIRSYNFADAEAAGWRSGSGSYLNAKHGLNDFRQSDAGGEERLTVVRRGTGYYVFRHVNGEVKLITTRVYTEFSGDAAIGFMTSGCVARYTDYSFSVDESEVDAFLSANLPDPKFNAAIEADDGSVITGSTAYKKLNESSAQGTDNGSGLKWSYIEGSYGEQNMVTAKITLVNNDNDASPSAGFTFSGSSDANLGGFHVLWFKTGIRSFNNARAAAHGWVAGQGTFITDTTLGLTSFESRSSLTMTVIRRGTSYYVLVNGALVTTREYDGVSGKAAVGFVTSGCTAKYEGITVTTDAGAINEALEGVGIQ